MRSLVRSMEGDGGSTDSSIAATELSTNGSGCYGVNGIWHGTVHRDRCWSFGDAAQGACAFLALISFFMGQGNRGGIAAGAPCPAWLPLSACAVGDAGPAGPGRASGKEAGSPDKGLLGCARPPIGICRGRLSVAWRSAGGALTAFRYLRGVGSGGSGPRCCTGEQKPEEGPGP